MDGPPVWADPWWVPAHLLGVLGFAAFVAGVAAVRERARGGRAEPTARVALGAAAAGTALLLPYYGAEAFGLSAVGSAVADPDAAGRLAELVRTGPWAATTFAAGLVALAVAGVVVAAVRRGAGPDGAHRAGPGASAGAVLVAVAMVLYLPQFFATPELRITHGVVLGVGCVLVGLARRRPVRAAAAVTGVAAG
ncbi:hypothetical protein [Pseudonocardia spirodelae]|uniref:DUF998 domain-containing protein n=1 Tax=Pseudonocardia spirodelae TaxID=3133431 RepID=A0ABU8TB65_9PSEU